jgi:sulfonate dioxygenase
MPTISETRTQVIPALTLRPQSHTNVVQNNNEKYKYSHLLPSFPPEEYPPLEPFDHSDPGHRALSHPDPRSFLRNATCVSDIQPVLGTEIEGIELTDLDSDGRDQLALFVRI